MARSITANAANPAMEPIYDSHCEQAVIGSVLYDRDAMAVAARILTAGDFWLPFHRFLFQAMLDMWARSEPVDIITLASEMWRRAKALPEADRLAVLPETPEADLAGCMAVTWTSVHVEYYARRVLDMADRRRMAEVGKQAVKGAFTLDNDLDSVVEETAAGVQAARHMPPDGRYAFIGDIADDVSFKPLPRHKLGGEFAALDKLSGGFEPGQMIVVAARPSVGKSAIVLQWLYTYCAEQGRPVGLISLEMPKRDLVSRIMALAADVDMHTLRGGTPLTLEQHHRVKAVRESLAVMPFAIDDDPVTTLPSVLARARAMAGEKVALIGIDYLQLITVPGKQDNRVQDVSRISAAMKQLARELQVPVIVLAQLNRGVEMRPDAEPRLSDLRDSGAIEQDADIVILLHRVNESTGHVKAIVGKNRNGPVGWVDLTFDKPTTSFRARAGL